MTGRSSFEYTMCLLAAHLMELHGDKIEMSPEDIERAKYRLDPSMSQTELVSYGNNLDNNVTVELRTRDRQILVVEVDPNTD